MGTDETLAKELRAVRDANGLLRNGQSLRSVVLGLKKCYDLLEARKDQVISTHLGHIR